MSKLLLDVILSEISYKNWTLAKGDMGEGFYIQWKFTDDKDQTWGSRKWYVSKHATVSEVVQTVLKAALTAEEHEARERFLYRGKQLFGPHLDVNALLKVADERQVRVNG
jgi:hypothetical protein